MARDVRVDATLVARKFPIGTVPVSYLFAIKDLTGADVASASELYGTPAASHLFVAVPAGEYVASVQLQDGGGLALGDPKTAAFSVVEVDTDVSVPDVVTVTVG